MRYAGSASSTSAFQSQLRNLKDEGVMLALATKIMNQISMSVFETANAAFYYDFAFVEANWDAKSKNIWRLSI